jgi:nucleotide-binding universal stress UspA family protein
MPESTCTTLESLLHPAQIVMATDLCDAETLLPLAIAQAKANRAQLTLVHALPMDPTTLGTAEATAPVGDAMNPEAFAERTMAELVQRARAEGVACDSVVRHGISAAEVIRDEIQRLGAERLVVGTHGRGRVGQLILGSVAKNLLRSVAIPIFAAGPRVKTPHLPAEPRRILFAVALKDKNQDQADADAARKMAESMGAELILVHVIEAGAEERGHLVMDIEEAKIRLDALIPDKTTMTVNLRTHIACGEIVEEILESASRFEANWILMGWHDKHHFAWLAESAVYRVMASSAIPVLTLPHPQKTYGTKTARHKEPSAALC